MATTFPQTSLANELQPLLATQANQERLRDIQAEIKCHERRVDQITGHLFFLSPVNGDKLAELYRIRDRVEFLRRQEKALRKAL